MNGIDCLFVHAPNLSNYYLPLGQFINNNFISMGVIPLANLALENGYNTEIIHMGVENLLNKDFSLVDYVKTNNVKIVGLSLFWFHQSYDVIDLAQKIKESSPDTFVYLGGLSASYYAEEILLNFPSIDAVVVGYGESSVIKLLNCVIKKSCNISEVPNLLYRINSDILSTNLYDIDKQLIDKLNYSNLKIIRNYEYYIKYFGLHEMPLSHTESIQKIMNQSIETRMFPLAIGRGCSTLCSYCGGNKNTCKKLYGADFLLWRKHDSVISDIEAVIKYGYEKVFICFDPTSNKQEYYVQLFRKIRKKGINISLYFECWSIPSKSFIDEFSKTFPDNNSHLLLSIDTISENTRRINRGQFFSNKELEDTIAYLEEKNVKYDLCFSIGLPGSSFSEDMKTYEYMKNSLQQYKKIGRVITFLIDLVPGSPIYENPSKYDVEVSYKTFMDYYREFSKPLRSTYALCNYRLINYYNDDRDNGTIEDFSRRLQLMKCKYFCGINELYRQDISLEENALECCGKRQEIFDKMGLKIKAEPFSSLHCYNDELKEVMRQYEKPRVRYK